MIEILARETYVMWLFQLVAAHFLCDFSLQTDTMAREKNPASTTELQKHVPWYYWMTAHAFIHGLAVLLLINDPRCAYGEVVVHWVTDYAKCKGWIGIKTDQAIHIACKVAWVALTQYP